MTANPADAVRDAHISLVRVKASRLSIQHADDLLAIEDGFDALHGQDAALTERLVEIERENLEGWKQAAHWRELYRIERAMRLMDNGLSSLDACYAAADKEIAAMQEPQP